MIAIATGLHDAELLAVRRPKRHLNIIHLREQIGGVPDGTFRGSAVPTSRRAITVLV